MVSTRVANSDDRYIALLQDLKSRIKSARLTAVAAVNRELIQLYWGIGQEILHRQEAEGWGAGVIVRLATDLRKEFPEMTGLSARNLGYMKSLAEAYPDTPFLQQVVAKLPWGHNIQLSMPIFRLPTFLIWLLCLHPSLAKAVARSFPPSHFRLKTTGQVRSMPTQHWLLPVHFSRFADVSLRGSAYTRDRSTRLQSKPR